MPYTVQLIAAGLIEVVYTGTIDRSAAYASLDQFASLAAGGGPQSYLFDLRGARLNLSPSDIHDLPNTWTRLDLNRLNRMAIIIEDLHEQQTATGCLVKAAVNGGWNVRLFERKVAAVLWLTLHQHIAVPERLAPRTAA